MHSVCLPRVNIFSRLYCSCFKVLGCRLAKGDTHLCAFPNRCFEYQILQVKEVGGVPHYDAECEHLVREYVLVVTSHLCHRYAMDVSSKPVVSKLCSAEPWTPAGGSQEIHG